VILEKHFKIEENLQKVKERKAHMVEYSRIANEMRLAKASLTTR
jgi:hypothetical protein